MSVNVVGGTWRNLIPRVNGILPGPASNYTSYGFAVDYRGARPTVYVIANDAVVDTIVMDDVTTPLYPMLYGNPTGFTVPGEFDEAINFGATAFATDAITALTAEGVDLTGFGLGWATSTFPSRVFHPAASRMATPGTKRGLNLSPCHPVDLADVSAACALGNTRASATVQDHWGHSEYRTLRNSPYSS